MDNKLTFIFTAILVLFLTGCNFTHVNIYQRIYENCESMCDNKNDTWTGLVFVDSDAFKCICYNNYDRLCKKRLGNHNDNQ